MARCIDADKLLNFLTMTDFADWSDYDIFHHFVTNAPTADVVPKSEYDAVVSAVDNSTKEFLKLHDEYQYAESEVERLKHILNCYALQYGTVVDQQRVIDKAKSDVAREIFEEIEKEIDLNMSVIQKILNAKGGRANGKTVLISKYDVFIEAKKHLAELKKKYTEE